MRSYPGRGFDEEEVVFNYRLSCARRILENGFGIMVVRWRIFLSSIHGDIDLCIDIVKAAVCIQNYILEDKAYCARGYKDMGSIGVETPGAWRQDVIGLPNCQRASCSNNSSHAAFGIRDAPANILID